MKILRVIASMDPASGGPCQGIRNSIPELSKLGAENEVVSLDDPGASFLGKDEFTIHALGPAKSPWKYSDKLYPWLKSNLSRFDAVIAHGLWLYPSHATFKAVKKSRNKTKQQASPRFFVMPHGMLDPYFQKAGTRKLKAIRNWVYWKLIEGSVINGADGVLFTCQAELELARQPFSPYRPKLELNVGYGVPSPPTFSNEMKTAFSRTSPTLHGRNYLLFLSRIHEKKGVDLLVNAYLKILKARPDFPCLVIAGPGMDTQYGKQLKQIIENEPGLTGYISFPGMLSGKEKWGAFYGCDAFVLPSHQENFGIAVAEALACSKPVLVSDQVNIWKEINQAGAGIVEPDTMEGIITLLNRWSLLSSSEKATMANNAFKAFTNHFAIEPAALSLYQAISEKQLLNSDTVKD
jgi:glycosyltransferase involved in cell wall biosynthesis